MSETKHIAGPWTMTVHCDIPPNNCLVGIATEDAGIASVQTWRSAVQGSCEETRANGHLIAAAPELLESIQNLLNQFEKWEGYHQWDEEDNEALLGARDIIAKAKGA